ncbi:DUF4329 domain-containing protein [Pontixanthobacter sp. CEM42]|uniref:DUF4329 domain-containing protein n=1 Tax=Pontixanthobacter sp. CEM42 TaxID=2792077 RepID=UPI001ADFE089|nr:DUF4329 domain-containing protein [Pontixanthobacter sp. CEM42]
MSDASRNGLILAGCALLWVVIFFRSALGLSAPDPRMSTISQAEVQQLARETLSELQLRSFAESREFCGVIYEDYEGELSVTRIIGGGGHSCAPAFLKRPGMLTLASFHTHGNYNPEYIGEFPSPTDLEADIAGEIDGYVSTPGGRFWRVDGQARAAELICDEGCLAKDPNYVSCAAAAPQKQRYTLEELVGRIERGNGPC